MLQALILAGGLGTRLRAIVDDRPKPMATIADKPFLVHQIEYLKAQGVTHIVLCVGYLHEYVQAYFGDGSAWGVQIDYSIEAEPLGTGGALRHAEQFVRGPFLVLNGDYFLDIDLQELVAFHAAQKAQPQGCWGTLALTAVSDVRSYGSVTLDPDHRIVQFREKSAAQVAAPGLINAGIYVLEPDVLQMIPAAQKVSIEKEVFPALMQHGRPLCGFEARGFFVDIGTPEGYYRFCEYIEGRESARVPQH